MASSPVVTFDLFSALLDSRTGAGGALECLADEHRWAVGGTDVYDHWDALTKRAHNACHDWVPHVDLARDALSTTYTELGVEGDPAVDLDRVYATLPEWPLWPDVARELPRLTQSWSLGVLSNVDDVLFARTPVAAFIDPELVMTSERLRAYKPHPEVYHRARERLGDLVHVATSARDVQGALEAGVRVVRLRRPGHRVPPAGPRPAQEVKGLAELAHALPGAT